MTAAPNVDGIRLDKRRARAEPAATMRSAVRQPGHRLYLALLIACTVLLVPVAIGMQRSGELGGDGPFYWGVQQALLQHGWFSIPDDIATAVASMERRPNLDGEGRLIQGLDGARYAVHFWLYPLLSLPFALLLQLAGVATTHAFPLLNAASFGVAIWVLHRSPRLDLTGKCVVLASFATTTINWYVAWSHPEVFTACLLLMASLMLLERRHFCASLLAAIASLQNPSAILLLGAIALVAIADAIAGARQAPIARALLQAGLRIGGGAVIAVLPYLYGLTVLGVANPILANGYVDFSQMTGRKLLSLIFDWNQGLVIAFPFLLTLLAGVIVLRMRHAGWRGLLRTEDALLLGMLAMALPVLTQVNFNAGQYYASRYLAWLVAPGIIWAGLQVQGPYARGGLWAWFIGFGFYAANFGLFLAQKLHYVLTVMRAGGLPYEDQLVMKPIAALLLAAMPAAYDPWPEIFIERTLYRELTVEEIRGSRIEAVGYPAGEGRFTKVITRQPELSFVAARLCPGGEAVAESSPGAPRFSAAGPGYFYLDGALRCRPLQPPRQPR
ncbi:hypothetical protein [Plastoroseomonas hellenica]|uniref:hypothetical protein n=1 Tax=Plastoroseomonas hellenica TaxID=2687306 RepID=UPI001BAD7E4D|nr:hypothetical protein [Plastoroseomonas hellenica]MBR0645501.1 hypothetical protein [Plastoroseomonas hellenica]